MKYFLVIISVVMAAWVATPFLISEEPKVSSLEEKVDDHCFQENSGEIEVHDPINGRC